MRKSILLLMLYFIAVSLTVNSVIARSKLNKSELVQNENYIISTSAAKTADMAYPYVDAVALHTGIINSTFSNMGFYGTNFLYGMHGPTFETPSGSDIHYLYGGTIWVGGIIGNDTLVSVGADGWNSVKELWPDSDEDKAKITEYEAISSYTARAEFYDTLTNPCCVAEDPFSGRPHLPLNLKIANRCHIFRSEPYNNAIIYDMILTNIGNETIHHGFIGFFMDGDVYYRSIESGFGDDITGFLRNQRIAYTIDNNGDPAEGQFDETSPIKTLAFKLLEGSCNFTDTNYNWWVSYGNPTLDFGPRRKDTVICDYGTGGLGTPQGDISKYCILSFPERDYDQISTCQIDSLDPVWLYPDQSVVNNISDGFDTRFLVSLGPFELMPDSNIRILHALFTGDSVHTYPQNDTNLVTNPDLYLANLNFTDLLKTDSAIQELASNLIDPLSPVIGLRLASQYSRNDIIWDPYVFPGIEGYNVYLYEIPLDTFVPYPGTIPPWYGPSEFNLVATVDDTTCSYTLYSINGWSNYFVNVANRTADMAGDPGMPLLIDFHYPEPVTLDNRLYLHEGESAIIRWDYEYPVDIDHYNVYRFNNSESYAARFHALYSTDSFYCCDYSEGDDGETVAPTDSFDINGGKYYYYTMGPIAKIDSGTTYFTDNSPQDSTFYAITAVDKYGYESEFSESIFIQIVPPCTKDILVLTNSTGQVIYDSIQAFYDSILLGYEYDIYSVSDTISLCSTGCIHVKDCPQCINTKDFFRYKMLIIDDKIGNECDYFLDIIFNDYLGNYGKLAYFGSFEGPYTYPPYNTAIYDWYHLSQLSNRFGIDSVFYAGVFYCRGDTILSTCNDSLLGFYMAEAVTDFLPDIAYDSNRYVFFDVFPYRWPNPTPPEVIAFKTSNRDWLTTESIYRYKSKYPTSVVENEIVGFKATWPENPAAGAYIFGFHLYYMEHEGAKQLIDYMFQALPYAGNGAQAVAAANIAGSNNLHNDPYLAIGIQDGNCVSLGTGGWIILDMGSDGINNVPGYDFIVHEAKGITKSGSSDDMDIFDEGINVFISENADGPWSDMGNGYGTFGTDMESTGLIWARFIKIVDDGDGDSLSLSPGYDLDAIEKLLPTGIVEDRSAFPTAFSLSQNYPNPFNNATTINFTLPGKSRIKIDIYNILGRKVKTIVDETKPAGSYNAIWDGTDSNNKAVASGIYFYRLTADDCIDTKKMILLK